MDDGNVPGVRRALRRAARFGVVVGLLGLVPGIANAGDWVAESVGVRYAMSATSLDDLYWQWESEARWRLPWGADLGRGWQARLHLGATAGWLSSRGDHAFIGSVGPLLSLQKDRWALRFEGGWSPTALHHHKFGEDDLGGYVHFTSHAGLVWDCSKHWSVGYRFHHMSNGGFVQPNPGLNLHGLELFFRF